MSYAEHRLGRERIKGAYAWRSFIEAGYIYTNSNHLSESYLTRINLRLFSLFRVKAFPISSDFPIESANPFLGFYAAITRKWVNGQSVSKSNIINFF